MSELAEVDLDKVDMEIEDEERRYEPEIVVLTERGRVPSVQEFFVEMIEQILASRLVGLAQHDHLTEANSPEPWLEEVLAELVKRDEVWTVVAEVLDSNEELRAFVTEEVRKVLRANLDTIGAAVKGVLDDLKVFDKLNEMEEKVATGIQLVGNTSPDKSGQISKLLKHNFEFQHSGVPEHDGTTAGVWSLNNLLGIAAQATWSYKKAGWLEKALDQQANLIADLQQRVLTLETKKGKKE